MKTTFLDLETLYLGVATRRTSKSEKKIWFRAWEHQKKHKTKMWPNFKKFLKIFQIFFCEIHEVEIHEIEKKNFEKKKLKKKKIWKKKKFEKKKNCKN